MGHIRFKCTMPRREPPDPTSPYPQINGALPTIRECEIAFVDDDGKEHSIAGATRFTFDTGKPGNAVAARIEVLGAEVDIESALEAGDLVVDAHGRIVGRTAPHGPTTPLIPCEDDHRSPPASRYEHWPRHGIVRRDANTVVGRAGDLRHYPERGDDDGDEEDGG